MFIIFANTTAKPGRKSSLIITLIFHNYIKLTDLVKSSDYDISTEG